MLYIDFPEHGVVHDSETWHLQGVSTDDGNIATLAVLSGGGEQSLELPVVSGVFSYDVPIDVGVNRLTVTVGAERANVSVIRLVTGRTSQDLTNLEMLLASDVKDWSEEQLLEFDKANSRGAYNYTDLNRVGAAVELLQQIYADYGYSVNVLPKTDWQPTDYIRHSQAEEYLADIENVRQVQSHLQNYPETPATLRQMDIQKANDIEKILIMSDDLLYWIKQSYIYCGEAFAGEF